MDIEAIWSRNGSTLALAVDALAAEFAMDVPAPWGDRVAERMRAMLVCEYDPRPSARPQLEPPPTVRPASPRGTEPGS